MEVMLDQGGSYESLTGDVLNSSTEVSKILHTIRLEFMLIPN
jgi:hypothetical protein